MMYKIYTESATAADLALDDDELYHRLAALKTFEDCAALVEHLHVSELAHYGEYASRKDTPGGHH